MKEKWGVLKENKNVHLTKEPSWEQVLNFFSTKISRPSFDTWIKNTTGEIEGDTIKVHCENSFQKDWVEERYNHLFSEAVGKVYGKDYKITYVGSI
jgi:chromosomal replication initiation ATPase DnaA